MSPTLNNYAHMLVVGPLPFVCKIPDSIRGGIIDAKGPQRASKTHSRHDRLEIDHALMDDASHPMDAKVRESQT